MGNTESEGKQPAAPARPAGMFRKLEKKQGKIRVALVAVSGAGKTYTALLMAQGIRKAMMKDGVKDPRIGIIDTENMSAADYADKFDGVLGVAIEPPFTVAKYIAAMKAAVDEGIDILILDSGTHAWSGEGGLLDKKSQLDSRQGTNQMGNWIPVTADHRQFLSMITHSKTHLIVTFRAKSEYSMEKDERTGKMKPVKIGLGPDQRHGLEYEFQVVFDQQMDHSVMVNKDRTGMFNGAVFVPTEQLGMDLYAWRMAGKDELADGPAVVQEPVVAGAAASTAAGGGVSRDLQRPEPEQTRAISELTHETGLTLAQVKLALGLGQSILTAESADKIIAHLKAEKARMAGVKA